MTGTYIERVHGMVDRHSHPGPELESKLITYYKTRFSNAMTSSGVLDQPPALDISESPPFVDTCPTYPPAGIPYPPTSHTYDPQNPDTPVALGIIRALTYYFVVKEAHLLTMHNVYWLLQMMHEAGGRL